MVVFLTLTAGGGCLLDLTRSKCRGANSSRIGNVASMSIVGGPVEGMSGWVEDHPHHHPNHTANCVVVHAYSDGFAVFYCVNVNLSSLEGDEATEEQHQTLKTSSKET